MIADRACYPPPPPSNLTLLKFQFCRRRLFLLRSSFFFCPPPPPPVVRKIQIQGSKDPDAVKLISLPDLNLDLFDMDLDQSFGSIYYFVVNISYQKGSGTLGSADHLFGSDLNGVSRLFLGLFPTSVLLLPNAHPTKMTARKRSPLQRERRRLLKIASLPRATYNKSVTKRRRS